MSVHKQHLEMLRWSHASLTHGKDKCQRTAYTKHRSVKDRDLVLSHSTSLHHNSSRIKYIMYVYIFVLKTFGKICKFIFDKG